MVFRSAVCAVAMTVLGSFGAAANEGGGPYAGWQERQIKALSSQEIEDLRSGRGMSMALPAELNGYPGPLHTLELAGQLGLDDAQRQRVQALYDAMKAEASALGTTLVEAEGDLDRMFADGSVGEDALRAAVLSAGRVRAELRLAHLRYHLSTTDILTPQQVADYARLRGYGADAAHHHGHH